MVLILYVDDILVGCDSPHGLENLGDAFLDRVSKSKITGQLNPDQPGTITFLGRELIRFAGSKNLDVRVPTSYLYECLANVSQTDTPPQIDLEKDTIVTRGMNPCLPKLLLNIGLYLDELLGIFKPDKIF